MRLLISRFNNLPLGYKKLLVYTVVAIITIVSCAPAWADSTCTVEVASSWKDHFPFDLIYPIGKEYVPTGKCPTINFWGLDREVCSIPQLTAIIKIPILARLAIKGLFEL